MQSQLNVKHIKFITNRSWCFPPVPSLPSDDSQLSHEDSRSKTTISNGCRDTRCWKKKKKITHLKFSSSALPELLSTLQAKPRHTHSIYTSKKRSCNYLKGMEDYTAESAQISPCKSNACTCVQPCKYASRTGTWATTALHYLGCAKEAV